MHPNQVADLVLEATKTLKQRVADGEIVKVPFTITGTVESYSSDQTTVMPDEPDAEPMHCRSLIGWIRAGARVQVLHEQGMNFVIGQIAPTPWVFPTADDGWNPSASLRTSDGVTVPTTGRGVWHRDGQVLDLQGFFTLTAAPPGKGPFEVVLPAGFRHGGNNTGTDVSALACGSGYGFSYSFSLPGASPGITGLREGFIVIYSPNPTVLSFFAAPATSPPDPGRVGSGTEFSEIIPWWWARNDQLSFHARVMLIN